MRVTNTRKIVADINDDHVARSPIEQIRRKRRRGRERHGKQYNFRAINGSVDVGGLRADFGCERPDGVCAP